MHCNEEDAYELSRSHSDFRVLLHGLGCYLILMVNVVN